MKHIIWNHCLTILARCYFLYFHLPDLFLLHFVFFQFFLLLLWPLSSIVAFSAFFVCSCTLDYLYGVLTIFFRFSAELSIAIPHKTNKCAYMVNIRISVEGTPCIQCTRFKYENARMWEAESLRWSSCRF